MRKMNIKRIVPPYSELELEQSKYLNNLYEILKGGDLHLFHFWINENKDVVKCRISAKDIQEFESLTLYLIKLPEILPNLEELYYI